MKHTSIKVVLLVFISLLSISTINAETQENIKKQIFSLIQKGSILLNDENGKTLISHNPNEMLVPASIIKILTSYIALDVLGKNYSFKTQFYADGDNNLTIKGWGDPFLVSEEVEGITNTIKQRGLIDIKQIYLDHSVFAPIITIPGVSKTSNPYDAINGALVVNFNTINIKKDAQGKVLSGEPETPLTPLAIKKAKVIRTGTKQRINLSGSKADGLQYVGELFSVFFAQAGIPVVNKALAREPFPSTGNLFYTHHNSRNLATVIKGLLKYSNNFIANQIFLTIGAEKKGYPATLEKSQSFFENYIKTKMNLTEQELVMCEGSGISRNNKITGNVMMHIMEEFRGSADLLSKKRGALAKSGTLDGVSNYAGYIKTGKGLRPFVIILNQKSINRDKILDLLVEYCKE